MNKGYYQILGCKPGDSKEKVKKQFRKLCEKHHPDKGGNPELFKKITEAYKNINTKNPFIKNKDLIKRNAEYLLGLIFKTLINGYLVNDEAKLLKKGMTKLMDDINGLERDINAIDSKINKLDKINKKITTKSKSNLYELKINEYYFELEEEKNELLLKQTITRKAVKMIENYSEENEPKWVLPMAFTQTESSFMFPTSD